MLLAGAELYAVRVPELVSVVMLADFVYVEFIEALDGVWS